jgi:23S rRNA (pseudouridine1915-N3)-methyltransferase
MKITVLAIGKTRGAETEWCNEYVKRLKTDVQIKELAASKSLPATETQLAEAALLLKNIPPKSFVIALDEHGKDISSREFAAKMQSWQDQGMANIVLMIGGADGLTDEVKKRADYTLSFGRATWPHRLVRVMLLEQLYRAQQINSAHPYHRD